MNIYAPEYYKSFKCVAGKCRHSCCVGWDIDIDSNTLDLYLQTDGDFGDKLKSNIVYNNGIPSLRLLNNKKCPFLNKDNLCDIIIEKGEDYLCDICAEHPRFRNYFSDREEIGLGLCCEEAARLILSEKYNFLTVKISGNEMKTSSLEEIEQYIINLRSEIFDLLNNVTADFNRCCFEISMLIGREFPIFSNNDIFRIYHSLEILDKSWKSIIKDFSNVTYNLISICKANNQYSKKLFGYFIYRHLSDAIIDGRVVERILFSILSTKVVLGLAYHHSNEQIDFETLCEFARMYSSEIEYSDENVDKILDFLTEMI